jgi:TonB-dependent Receptor Plug Domain
VTNRSMNSTISKSAIAVLFAAAGMLFAQQDITAEWKLALNDLEREISVLTTDENSAAAVARDGAEALRASLVSFSAFHSEIPLHIPESLPERPSLDALRQQVDQLKIAVDEVIRRTPSSPFNLGGVEVNVSAKSTEPSPVVDSIDQSEIRNLNLTTAAKALDYLPGVSIQHLATNRNEAGIMVRGFTTRGQVPLYLDGIPISVPYDGYVDFNRFLTSDIAEIQVARGYSSPLLVRTHWVDRSTWLPKNRRRKSMWMP